MSILCNKWQPSKKNKAISHDITRAKLESIIQLIEIEKMTLLSCYRVNWGQDPNPISDVDQHNKKLIVSLTYIWYEYVYEKYSVPAIRIKKVGLCSFK